MPEVGQNNYDCYDWKLNSIQSGLLFSALLFSPNGLEQLAPEGDWYEVFQYLELAAQDLQQELAYSVLVP